MKIRQIALDDDEMPESVLVEMTVTEALFVAQLVGSIPPADLPRYGMADDRWRVAMHSVYDAMAGGLFNRFWDGGVREAMTDD